MIYGEVPFFDVDMNVMLSNIRNVKYSFPPDHAPEVKEYIDAILKFVPSERQTDFMTLKNMEFFKQIDFSKL